MRVFLAGASGAVGQRLTPMLVGAGHQVTGMTRSPSKADRVRAMGATPLVADALDAGSVLDGMRRAAPEIAVHELTAIPGAPDLRHFDREFATTNRLRTEGLDNLIAAARAVGCRRMVAQSYTGWPYARTGSPVKTEDDPLDPDPPAELRSTLQAIQYLERTVTGLEEMDGIVLRYGAFYGPGTSMGAGGSTLEQVRKRRIPIVGGGAGIWSFTHIDDAAAATAMAIE